MHASVKVDSLGVLGTALSARRGHTKIIFQCTVMKIQNVPLTRALTVQMAHTVFTVDNHLYPRVEIVTILRWALSTIELDANVPRTTFLKLNMVSAPTHQDQSKHRRTLLTGPVPLWCGHSSLSPLVGVTGPDWVKNVLIVQFSGFLLVALCKEKHPFLAQAVAQRSNLNR